MAQVTVAVFWVSAQGKQNKRRPKKKTKKKGGKSIFFNFQGCAAGQFKCKEYDAKKFFFAPTLSVPGIKNELGKPELVGLELG